MKLKVRKFKGKNSKSRRPVCDNNISVPAAICIGTVILALLYEAWFYFLPLPSFPSPEANIAKITKIINGTNFSFAVAGDNRNDLGVFPAILQKIDSDPEISFMIHTGDAVMTPRKVFFHKFVNTLRDRLHKPFLMVPGNHDIQGRFWATPDLSMYAELFGPTHYTFCLGNLRFVLFDSNHLRAVPED